MNIITIKKNVESFKGKNIKIKQNIGRNKMIEYSGYIKEVYPNLFVVQTLENLKTFSYSDILIKNIIIKENV